MGSWKPAWQLHPHLKLLVRFSQSAASSNLKGPQTWPLRSLTLLGKLFGSPWTWTLGCCSTCRSYWCGFLLKQKNIKTGNKIMLVWRGRVRPL